MYLCQKAIARDCDVRTEVQMSISLLARSHRQMPSSHRPSRSTNPLLQPSWHEKHKKYAPVSVSLVFAEPEQGAPLASASQVIVSTRLDTVSVQSSDDTSILSQRLTCRQSLSSSDLQRPIEEVRQPHQQETSSASITLQYEEEPSSTLFLRH